MIYLSFSLYFQINVEIDDYYNYKAETIKTFNNKNQREKCREPLKRLLL